jgi:hypothetical protein
MAPIIDTASPTCDRPIICRAILAAKTTAPLNVVHIHPRGISHRQHRRPPVIQGLALASRSTIGPSGLEATFSPPEFAALPVYPAR